MWCLTRSLGIDDWHNITLDNLDEWIEKISKLKSKDFQVHVVFNPDEIEKDLQDLK